MHSALTILARATTCPVTVVTPSGKLLPDAGSATIDGAGSWTSLAVGANVTHYTVLGLKALVPYTFRVRAVNEAGPSAYSAVASARTLPDAPSRYRPRNPRLH